jgi:acetyl-CoA synthetase (ADP-forming)
VLAEAIDDAAVRLAPLERIDAMEMIADLTTTDLLGAWRGEPAVDLEALADILMALSAVVAERPDIVSIDLNPLIVTNGQPIAVDALVELMA